MLISFRLKPNKSARVSFRLRAGPRRISNFAFVAITSPDHLDITQHCHGCLWGPVGYLLTFWWTLPASASHLRQPNHRRMVSDPRMFAFSGWHGTGRFARPFILMTVLKGFFPPFFRFSTPIHTRETNLLDYGLSQSVSGQRLAPGLVFGRRSRGFRPRFTTIYHGKHGAGSRGHGPRASCRLALSFFSPFCHWPISSYQETNHEGGHGSAEIRRSSGSLLSRIQGAEDFCFLFIFLFLSRWQSEVGAKRNLFSSNEANRENILSCACTTHSSPPVQTSPDTHTPTNTA